MPEYELKDLDGRFSWIRLPKGTYVVDQQHEEEFISLWEDYLARSRQKDQ